MFAWLRGYRTEWLGADMIAGLVAAAVVIPKAMAYGTIAGLPVQVGLYTALVPMVVYAMLGTSAPLSVSTTTTIAILTASALGQVVPEGNAPALAAAAVTLTLLVGAALVIAGALRLGFVANFISEPVLVGFKAGIGCVIVLDQLPKLLGVHFPKGGFFHNLVALAQAVPDASMVTAAVAAATILVLLGIEHFLPRVPAPLVAVAASILAVSLLGLTDHGVATVGSVPTGLPHVVWPDLALIEKLWPAALGIALMSFTETIAAARAFARSDEPPLRANRELLATGLGNAAGALLGTMPSGGGTSQTAVNRFAGARSQLASLVTAAGALLTMLVLAPWIGQMPQATLAAVVIVYSVGLIKPADLRNILKVRRTEFVWAIAALAGVVLLGTLQGILTAIVLSILALAYQVSDPPVHVLGRKRGTNVFRPRSAEHPDDETYPGLLLLRVEGRLFFANVERVAEKMRPLIAQASPKVVVIHMRGVFDLEYTALKMLTEAEQRNREHGVQLWLSSLNPGVLDVVMRSPLGETLGRERMCFNLEDAVARFQKKYGNT
jgi:high affinity sulfate transporter 1